MIRARLNMRRSSANHWQTIAVFLRLKNATFEAKAKSKAACGVGSAGWVDIAATLERFGLNRL